MQLNKVFKLSLLLLVVMSIMCASAFAGTLAAGTSLQVTSNNNEISGKYNLVGVWSTTPTAADSIIITNSQLPAPYGLKSQLVIDVPQPSFEQVFSVQSQKPVYTYALWISDNKFFNDIDAKIEAEFQKENPNAVVVVSKQSCSSLVTWTCKGYKIYATQQKGWVGQVTNSGIDFEQPIVIDGVGTIMLSTKSATSSQLSGTIPGVAIARLLGFSSWTNALLSEKNVYAFHAGSSTSVGQWLPFSDNGQYYTSYIATETNLKNVLNVGGLTTGGAIESKFNSVIIAANNQANLLVGASTNYPSSWLANSNKAGITSSSNLINVPLKTTVLTANIQLILNGEKFGVFVATGIPKIDSIDSSVKFSETASAMINYVAKNDGQSSGSFQTSLVCPSGKIQGQADQFTLNAGQSVNKQMYVTAKTDANKDLSETCVFSLTESTTQTKVSRNVVINVEAKANCAQGQQSDPYVSGALTVVDVYDSSCKVIDQVKCTTASQDTKLVNGKYECVAKSGTSGQGATNFSVPLLIASLLIGLALAITAYVNLKAFSFGKYTKIALTIIVLFAFVFGIMATVYLVNAFIKYFSI